MFRENPSKLSDEAKKLYTRKIINLYREDGLGTVAIAKLFDTYPQEITDLLKEKGVRIRPPHRPIKRFEKQRLKDLVSDYIHNGLTLRELEEKYGIGRYSIRRYFNHWGIPLRSVGYREVTLDLKKGADIDIFIEDGYPLPEIAASYTDGDIDELHRVHNLYKAHIDLLKPPKSYMGGSLYTHRIEPYSITLAELFEEPIVSQPKSVSKPTSPKVKKKRYNIKLDMAELKDLADLGYSVPTLAQQFNVSEPTIRSRLTDIGAPIYTTTKGEVERVAHNTYLREFSASKDERMFQRNQDVEAAELQKDEIKAYYLNSALIDGKDLENTARRFNLPKSIVKSQLYNELQDILSILLKLHGPNSIESVILLEPNFLEKKDAAFSKYSEDQISRIFRDFVKEQLPYLQGKAERQNPYSEKMHNALGVGVGFGGTLAIERLLNAKTEMSKNKRVATSGAIGVTAGLATYAVTKKECALWGSAGSLIGALLALKIYS